jgi:hypothetical protein
MTDNAVLHDGRDVYALQARVAAVFRIGDGPGHGGSPRTDMV